MAKERTGDEDIWAVFGSHDDDSDSDEPEQHAQTFCPRGPPNENFQVFDSSNDDSLPHRGKGLRALRSFSRGDLILQEAPAIRVLNCHAASCLKEAQELHARAVQASFNSLSPTAKAAVMDLSICEKWLLHENEHGECPRLNGRFQTNSFRLDDDGEGGESQRYGALFLQLAQINHSCRPNVKHTWRPDLHCILIHATRDIAVGDELLISYYMPRNMNDNDRESGDGNDDDFSAEMLQINAREAGELRRAFLRDEFSFECQCEVCLRDLGECGST